MLGRKPCGLAHVAPVRLGRPPDGVVETTTLPSVAGATGLVHRAGARRPHNGVIVRATGPPAPPNARSGASSLVSLPRGVPLSVASVLATGEPAHPRTEAALRPSFRPPVTVGIVGTALVRAVAALDAIVRAYDANVARDAVEAAPSMVLLAARAGPALLSAPPVRQLRVGVAPQAPHGGPPAGV